MDKILVDKDMVLGLISKYNSLVDSHNRVVGYLLAYKDKVKSDMIQMSNHINELEAYQEELHDVIESLQADIETLEDNEEELNDTIEGLNNIIEELCENIGDHEIIESVLNKNGYEVETGVVIEIDEIDGLVNFETSLMDILKKVLEEAHSEINNQSESGNQDSKKESSENLNTNEEELLSKISSLLKKYS
jgi:chromosome segregation ATPase